MNIEFTIALSPVDPTDGVVHRHLSVILNGAAQPVQDLPPDAVSAVIVVPEGTAVECFVTDHDASDNTIEGDHLTFTAKNTTPPHKPAAPVVSGQRKV